MSEQSRLMAQIDGVVLDEEAARELWKEFSAHMDANKGDMAGFAKSKGWHSVAPEFREGKAVLFARTTPGPAAPPLPAGRPAGKARPRPSTKPKPKQKPGAPGKGAAKGQKAGPQQKPKPKR